METMPGVDRYATANRIQPSLKPKHHFKELAGNREIFAGITQCQTENCYQGDYYSSMFIEE